MKKWLKGFLFTAAGRAQLVGIVVAFLGTTAYGQANPEFLKAVKDNLGPIIVGVVAVIGAVDMSGVAAANIKKAKEGKE